MKNEIDYYKNDPELEKYEMLKSYSKAYPALTKVSLAAMVDVMFKLKDNKEDLEYLVKSLVDELNY